MASDGQDHCPSSETARHTRSSFYRPLDAVERSAAADEVVSALNPGGRLKAVSPRSGLTLLPVL
ncbi:MAG: hypothetical protein P8Y93_07030 [Acidobacteriota bacterium]